MAKDSVRRKSQIYIFFFTILKFKDLFSLIYVLGYILWEYVKPFEEDSLTQISEP